MYVCMYMIICVTAQVCVCVSGCACDVRICFVVVVVVFIQHTL